MSSPSARHSSCRRRTSIGAARRSTAPLRTMSVSTRVAGVAEARNATRIGEGCSRRRTDANSSPFRPTTTSDPRTTISLDRHRDDGGGHLREEPIEPAPAIGDESIHPGTETHGHPQSVPVGLEPPVDTFRKEIDDLTQLPRVGDRHDVAREVDDVFPPLVPHATTLAPERLHHIGNMAEMYYAERRNFRWPVAPRARSSTRWRARPAPGAPLVRTCPPATPKARP